MEKVSQTYFLWFQDFIFRNSIMYMKGKKKPCENGPKSKFTSVFLVNQIHVFSVFEL